MYDVPPATRDVLARHAGDKLPILNIGFNFPSYEEVCKTIQRWKERHERHYIVVVNPMGVLTSQRDALMEQSLLRASLTLPDGVGIVIAARFLGYGRCVRIPGPDLALQVCEWGLQHGYRHYFFGGAPGVPEKMAEGLSLRLPGLRIAGTYSPPFRHVTAEEDVGLVDMINAAQPDVLWVGLGAPKQEKWMHAHLDRVNAPVMIGIGAAFDFFSGRVVRAPMWVRKAGFEWLYRHWADPKRPLSYTLTIPTFFSKVIVWRALRALSFR